MALPSCLVGFMMEQVFQPHYCMKQVAEGEEAGGSCLKLENKLNPKYVSIFRLQQAKLLGKVKLLKHIYAMTN